MKILRTAALVFAMVLFCAVSSYAVPMHNDEVTYDKIGTYGTTGGGEFNFQVHKSDGSVEEYTTFCLEYYEHNGGGMLVDNVADYAEGGGNNTDNSPAGAYDVGVSSSGRDFLSTATKWLFWTYMYAPETLGATPGNIDPDERDLLADHVQRSIWYIEGELDQLFDTFGDQTFFNTYVAGVGGAQAFAIPETYEVKVMNLYNPKDRKNPKRQSHIFLYPVPEPGTIMLLGLGLLGLVVGGRKKIFKE